MRKIIYSCDICGSDTEVEEFSFPVIMPRQYITEDRNCGYYKRPLKVKSIDLCYSCATKVFKSFDNELKERLRH